MRIIYQCVIGLMVSGFAIGGPSQTLHAQSLRYDLQPEQTFAYRYDIAVDTGSSVISYKGITKYRVTAVEGDQLKINYTGGLQESTKRNANAARRPGFGPFGGGPPRFPSPFQRPTFAGKTQTTNSITLSPQGSVIAMKGDSQLPYLLGNVSLMPFESLPKDNQKQWSTGSGVSISETSNNNRNRFDPFGPVAGSNKESVQAATEVTRYSLKGTAGDLVTVSRTYDMKMPKSSDGASFDMTGTGTWTFNTKEHIPHALDMKYKLIVKKGNSNTTVPVSVKYARVAPEELAKMAADAKRKADEKAQAAAAAKLAAETPLTAEEKRNALSVLASGDPTALVSKLNELAKKKLETPDPEVASAIERYLTHENNNVKKAASSALTNWSASYRLRRSLAKSYQGPGVLKSTERVVESITPLYVGQLVQAQQPGYGGFWRAAKVEELLPDGTVKLGFLTWGKVRSSSAVKRRNIQLAPDELEQPAKPKLAMAATTTPSATTPSGQARTWSDATGRFQVEAVFVSMRNGVVQIKRTNDGRVIPIPIAKLSPADQTFLKQLQAENPFAVK